VSTKHLHTDLPQVDVTFDIEAFNELVRSQGVKLTHYRAQRCPVGLVVEGDIRRPHPHHEGCFNGFIYTKAGCITAAITSNNKKKSNEDVGYVDFSTVQASFPQTYDDTDEKFIVAPYDRFYLADEAMAVVQWQLFTAHESGLDRLKFPVVCVQGEIIDSRGERYSEGDFTITPEGAIQWSSRRPVADIDMGPGLSGQTERGAVCSVRYTYRPYWYVGAMPHELRIVQTQDGFERKASRGPQMCVLHREYVGQTVEQEADQNLGNSADLRKVMAPMYGGFGEK
jgi:hypothetical protein